VVDTSTFIINVHDELRDYFILFNNCYSSSIAYSELCAENGVSKHESISVIANGLSDR